MGVCRINVLVSSLYIYLQSGLQSLGILLNTCLPDAADSHLESG